MALETKISDNFIYESVLDKAFQSSDETPFTGKILQNVIDSRTGNGSYSSGSITIDATGLANSSESYLDWSEGYIVLPYNIKLTGTASIATAAVTPTNAGGLNFLTSLKNNSLIDSITVESGGKSILTATSNLSQLVNFKMHSTTSVSNLEKMNSSLNYWPDSVGNYDYSASSLGVNNSKNNPYATTFGAVDPYNEGVYKRQLSMAPYTSSTTTLAKQIVECSNIQLNATTSVNAVNITTIPVSPAATTVLSDIHFLATIRLKDLHDYFASHVKLSKIGYKIVIRVNQGVSTFNHSASGATTTPFTTGLTITSQTFTPIGGSLYNPSMIHVGSNSIAATANITTWSNAVTIAANSLTLTSQVDTSTSALLNGVFLYVPSYVPSPTAAARLLREPSITRSFLDVYGNLIQNQGAGAYISSQLCGGLSNIKALVLIPYVAQNTMGMNSFASAMNPAPGTTDPQISLTNLQITLNSKPVLSDRLNYSFDAFLNNTSQLFGLNGNQSDFLNSGIIDYKRFSHNFRYYCFDLSRYSDSQNDIPQMLTLSTFNNSNVAIDIYAFILYGRSAEFRIAEGSLEVQ